MTDSEAAYQKAAEIADRLLAKGLPIVGFEAQDLGHKVGWQIQLPDGRRWAFRMPMADLSDETVEKLIQAYL
jgi:hypothetical protein